MIFMVGQKVKIISHKYTDRTQGMAGRYMFDMVDHIWIIEKVYQDSVKLNGYYWDKRDIIPIIKIEEPKPKIFHFDPKYL